MYKFNPTELTTGQVVDWIRAGDIQEAEDMAQRLAIQLMALADNRDKLLSLRGDVPGLMWLGTDELKFIAESLLAKASRIPGKSTKSGAELFAKVLVPNKTTRSQFRARMLAALVHMNLPANANGGLTKVNRAEITRFINYAIEQNNQKFKPPKLEGWNPSMPKRKTTEAEVEKAYRQFLPEINEANGVRKIKLK